MSPKQQNLIDLVSKLTQAVRSHACSTAVVAFCPGVAPEDALAKARNDLEMAQNDLQKFVEEHVT